MFLKSIEVKGFKSFADKTVLDFKGGITAVVGPNGSGKSNISDAVKWVLGEQSIKSLRGNKMEDIIFSGTQYRKAVSLAYVCLSLDNTDGELPINYSQVSISRRLYRSGDSEYYINNTQCRLKDVQELFMDTGIGKEGYSIIGQGKIDKILSGKSEDRRSLLEEAAGIVKYKTRKGEAERKLQSMDGNLVRINDILSTFEDRIEPLRIDSEKAESFLNLSNNLKEKEINLILDSLEKVNSKIGDISSKEQDFEGELNRIREEDEKFQREILELNKELSDFEEKDKEDKKAYYGEKAALGEIQGELNLLKVKITNNSEYINKSEEELRVYSDKGTLYKETFKDLQIDLNKRKEEKIALEEKIQKLTLEGSSATGDIKKLKEEIEKLKEEEIDLISLISEVKNNTLMIKNNSGILKNRLLDLTGFNEEYKASLEFNGANSLKYEKEIIKIKEKINILETENKNFLVNSQESGEKLQSKEKSLKELNAELNKAWSKENTLKTLENSYEGYNRAVKTLMQRIEKGDLEHYTGKCALLGEIIKVNKNEEIALEIALASAISNIITDDEVIAKNLINYLKKNNIGRATFLPLSTVRVRGISENLENIKNDGFIGIASDLISYPIKYKNAIEFILGRVIIAKDMYSAVIIGKKIGYKYKIVTLLGDVVNAGGSLTGGSASSVTSGIIGRKREILDLKEKIESLKEEEVKKEKEIGSYKEDIIKMGEKIETNKNKINNEVIEITKFNGKISALEEDSNKLKSNIELSIKEIETIKDSLNNSKEELLNKEESIKTLQDKEKSLSLEVEEKEKKVGEKEEENKGLFEEITNFKIEKASKDQYIISKESEIERINLEIGDINNKIEEDKKDIESKKEKIKGIDKRLQTLCFEIEEKEKVIKEAEGLFIQRESSIIDLRGDIEIKNRKVKDVYEEKSKIETDIHKIEINKAKLETELEGLYEYLISNHNLTYAEALPLKVEGLNIGKLKEEIKSLKEEISSLGIINVGSIEEYKEVSQKYIFMSTQREDIIKSKEEILLVIGEMTKKMRIIFNKNFQMLRIYFDETFKELFKGGSADLILSDTDELTADIEINVQPPGKKLGSINLLSGGEKVLSAIALLFAILKMKPTPFCILDEIEAALDDSNVSRYADFLKKFSGSIQFIVITHRKGTMEVSDILYGVTMEEKGVSKIVSVKLGKDKLEMDRLEIDNISNS